MEKLNSVFYNCIFPDEIFWSRWSFFGFSERSHFLPQLMSHVLSVVTPAATCTDCVVKSTVCLPWCYWSPLSPAHEECSVSICKQPVVVFPIFGGVAKCSRW